MPKNQCTSCSFPRLFAAVAALALGAAARADYSPVYGGPAYDPATGTGYRDRVPPVMTDLQMSVGVNNAGTAAGFAHYYETGVYKGFRAVRFDAAGAGGLGILSADAGGLSNVYAWSINETGLIAGYAQTYAGGSDGGLRAVRLEPGAVAPTELGHLGTDDAGFTKAWTSGVNAAGTVIGVAHVYSPGSADYCTRGVRWDAGGATATKLEVLGPGDDAGTYAYPRAINTAGTIVGYADRYYMSGTLFATPRIQGMRAVRWDAGQTTATELEGLPPADEYFHSSACAINDAGTIVGYSQKSASMFEPAGDRPVRWEAGSTSPTELDILGVDAFGQTQSWATDINAAGTAIGFAYKHADGEARGKRAVRWDAGGTAVTELGGIAVSRAEYAESGAAAISDDGFIVGYAYTWDAPYIGTKRAVLWGPDGVAIDLNTLIDPASGWTLLSATSISKDGRWITGVGSYEPEDGYQLNPYVRLWVMANPVPEPICLVFLAVGAALLRRRG